MNIQFYESNTPKEKIFGYAYVNKLYTYVNELYANTMICFFESCN